MGSVVCRIALWSLVTTMVLTVSAAVAQTGGTVRDPGGAKLRARRVFMTCNDFVPTCNRAEDASFNVYRPILLSCRHCGPCRTNARGGTKLRAACGDDLQRFCADVRPGGGRLVQCLSSHAPEVSPACGNTIVAVLCSRRNSRFKCANSNHTTKCACHSR